MAKTIKLNSSEDLLFDKTLLDNAFNAYSEILSNVDLNDVKENGCYYVNNCTNMPSGTNGVLIVIRSGSGTVRQFFFRTGTMDSNDDQWFTRQVGTTGGTWLRIIRQVKSGEVFSVQNNVQSRPHCVGAITNASTSSTTFKFLIPVGRVYAYDMSSLSISASSLYVTIRGATGQILGNTDLVANTSYSVATYLTNSGILVIVTYNGQLASSTSQQIIDVEINNASFTFS